MKKIILIIVSSFIILTFLFLLRVQILNSREIKENEQKQIGIYHLDIKKTVLGIYSNDIEIYKNLTIQFKQDNTFEFNISVPFINSKSGTWKASGTNIDEWNNIYFSDWDYTTGISGEQFTQCCDSDSTFYFNSMTPKKNMTAVGKIWFKKLTNR